MRYAIELSFVKLWHYSFHDSNSDLCMMHYCFGFIHVGEAGRALAMQNSLNKSIAPYACELDYISVRPGAICYYRCQFNENECHFSTRWPSLWCRIHGSFWSVLNALVIYFLKTFLFSPCRSWLLDIFEFDRYSITKHFNFFMVIYGFRWFSFTQGYFCITDQLTDPVVLPDQ